MKKFDSSEVATVFENYPAHIRLKMLSLRQLVLDTASETDGVKGIEETLKWGEPSYLVKGGSTVRIDWKAKNPQYYAIYFNCKTKLVETFFEVYGNIFRYEGNRAIVFEENEKLPVAALRHCISISFTYHKRKHLPLLGM